jgi:preprotein translocase subunit SecA
MLAKAKTGNHEGPEFEEAFKKYQNETEGEKQEVINAGGLYIIGTERHESRRIDNQLRGRSGRQGDPGGSRVYLSLEDNLMRIFNGEMIQRIMNRLNVPEDEPITHRMVTRSIEGAQKKVEGHNFDIRKHLLDFDNVMNQQRTIIYGTRKKILEGKEDLDRVYLDYLSDVTTGILENFASETQKKEFWNLEGLNGALQENFGIRIDFPALDKLTPESITQIVSEAVKKTFDGQKEKLGQFYAYIQKMVLLQTIDQRWKEHLLRVDRLKEGINLRGYAQKDPVIEYKKEAFGAFEHLLQIIKSDSIERFVKIQIVPQETPEHLGSILAEPDFSEMDFSGASEVSAERAFEPSASRAAGESSRESSSGRMRMSSRPENDEGPKPNRAQRRNMDKRKR